MEENEIPRLLADASVETIWEGTTNTLALDVVRVLVKTRGAAVKALIDVSIGASVTWFADSDTERAEDRTMICAYTVGPLDHRADQPIPRTASDTRGTRAGVRAPRSSRRAVHWWALSHSHPRNRRPASRATGPVPHRVPRVGDVPRATRVVVLVDLHHCRYHRLGRSSRR